MAQRFTAQEVNVPIGIEFALVDGSGLVMATVMWLENYETGALSSQIYAPTERSRRKIPCVSPELSDWYREKVRSDALVEYTEVNLQSTYRIDYLHAGLTSSYRFSLAADRRGVACLKPRTIYRRYPGGLYPVSFKELVGMMDSPEAMMITGVNRGMTSAEADEQMKVLYGLHHKELVVWNEADIQRNRHCFNR